MIGYDFDGIIVSDVHISKEEEENGKYPFYRSLLRPIFLPRSPYFIVTARPIFDKPDTEVFIDKWFTEKPEFVVYKPSLEVKSSEYKVTALTNIKKEVNVSYFIESDIKQYNYLKDHIPDIKFIHLASLLGKMFSSTEYLRTIHPLL